MKATILFFLFCFFSTLAVIAWRETDKRVRSQAKRFALKHMIATGGTLLVIMLFFAFLSSISIKLF